MPASAICAAHGLRFDPHSSTGCVLCKRGTDEAPQTNKTDAGEPVTQDWEVSSEDEGRISLRELAAAMLRSKAVWLGVFVAVGLLGYRMTRKPELSASDITLGGALEARTEGAVTECRAGCAVKAERSATTCAINDVRCHGKVQQQAVRCDESCAPTANTGSPFFRYTRGAAAPKWWELLERIDRVRPELSSRCGLEDGSRVDLYFRQLPDGRFQTVAEHGKMERGQCAAQLLGPILVQPGRSGYSLLASFSPTITNYKLMMDDAIATLERARSPGDKAQAEQAVAVYTRRFEQQRDALPRELRPWEAATVAAERAQKAAEERRYEAQLRSVRDEERWRERQRLDLAYREQQVMQIGKAVTHDDLENEHVRGHIGHEREKWRREYRNDDRQNDRDTWDDVERMRERREANEHHERWERDSKVRAMEWRNEWRRRRE